MELKKVVWSYQLQWKAILSFFIYQYDITEMVGTPGHLPFSILPLLVQISTST